MKRECSIVRDVLPLYFENMVREDTAVFVKEHLENCSDCAAELECLKSGKKIDKAETSERENDTNVITAVKKKIAKRIFKIVGVVCLVFVVILSAILLYIGISYPVTKDSISLSTKTEDILNDNNEVCGQRITLYNLQYHNNFSKNAGSMSWGYPLNAENQYIEVIVELEDDTLQISSAK